MGKNLQQRESEIPFQNNNPGCMWGGVLNMLKYYQWRHIKKRFPNMRRVNSKHATRVGNEGYHMNPSENDKIPLLDSTRIDYYMVDEKMAQSTPVTKGSVKSRIKALISDELYKRKGRHQRSSSYPERCHLERTDSFHRLEPAVENLLSAVTLNNESPLAAVNLNNNSPKTSDNVNFPATTSPDPLVPKSFEVQNFEDSDAILTDNQLGHNDVDETGKKFIENHTLIPKNSDTRKQSLVNAKEMLDALDLININKEFLLKLLQGPTSPLAHHFHSQQALSSKRAYSKSVSFSSPGSSSIRGSSQRKLNLKQKGIEPDAVEPKSREYIRSSSMPSIAPEYRRKNQVVMKRFKDLRHKLKHIINENNNDKHWIAMDGVLHKIPRGHELPKDLKIDVDNTKNHFMSRDVKDSPKSSNESDNSLPSTNKSESSFFSRTSSLSESLDRYSQLYESCFNRESKQTSKLKTEDANLPQTSASKSIRRISSSPDLKYYSCHSEESSNASSPSQVRNDLYTAISGEQLDKESQVKSVIQQNIDREKHTVDEDQQGLKTASNIEPEANLDLVSDDSGISVTSDTAFQKQDPVIPSETIIEPEEPNITNRLESKFSEHTAIPESFSTAEETDLKPIDSLEDRLEESIQDKPIVAESKVVKMEMPSKHLQFQVGAKDKAEFDYVKDILELSGFSGNELLGTWHSDNQPLDPSMLEEMESSMIFDSECFGDEEGYPYPCDHLLLFDLINQVLMEIYERSYTYYPSPLSSLSHIHPMPEGNHVLHEVWENISWYLSLTPEADQLLDHILSRDLSKNDGWMNLQFDSECVAIEVEDMIFDDLMDDMIFDDLLEGVIWS